MQYSSLKPTGGKPAYGILGGEEEKRLFTVRLANAEWTLRIQLVHGCPLPTSENTRSAAERDSRSCNAEFGAPRIFSDNWR